jgi:hypothetical protein
MRLYWKPYAWGLHPVPSPEAPYLTRELQPPLWPANVLNYAVAEDDLELAAGPLTYVASVTLHIRNPVLTKGDAFLHHSGQIQDGDVQCRNELMVPGHGLTTQVQH